MTSSRGQNVSVFQPTRDERWKSPVAEFNLGRTVSDTEKNSSRPLCKSSSGGVYANPRRKDLTGKNVNSSIHLNSGNRELSPVRWCNGKVDGVYLGKSGWVHVQERSLDDCKEVVYCDNSFYTLPYLKRFPETDVGLSEGRQCNRPLNLPFSSKKYAIRANYRRPSNFDQELESISPPSVTPIISPPPAFKDDGVNVEFPGRSIRKPFYSEELFRAELEGSFCSPKEKRNPFRFSPQGFSRESSGSTLKQERPLCQTRQLKSLDDDFSNTPRHDRRVNKISFHSLDNDIRTGGSCVAEASDSESFLRNFEDPRKKISCEESDKKDVEDYEKNKNTSPNGYFLELLESSKEELRARNPVKSYRQRNYQRNGRRASSGGHKSRSSSSDSSSSSSNKNSEKIVSSRRTYSVEKHKTFELDNSCSRNSKQFYVKRSRSLQLTEKRSPCESSLNNCSGKSWDSTPPEYPALQVADRIRGGEVQYPQNLHHFLVTVNGESIPVGTSSSQSLNKITTSEEQQKKLILEAEKEARIISEFLSGTRSREAARNLLVHRYFNKHEDVGSKEMPENSAPKDVCESYFSESRRREHFWKKNKPNSSAAFLQQPPPNKPLTSFFRVPNMSNRAGSPVSFQNLAEMKKEKRKKEGVEGKGRRGSSSSSEQCSKGRHSKIKVENANRFLDQTYHNPAVEKLPFPLLGENQVSVPDGESEASEIDIKTAPLASPGRMPKGRGRDSAQNSSPSSSSASSSLSTCHLDFGANMEELENVETCSLFEAFASGGKTKIPLAFRPESVPGNDDSVTAAVDQRSLSLPRSFLSLTYSNHREFFRWKHREEGNLEERASDFLLNTPRSRTAPATPTLDFKYGKSSESLNQMHFTGGSYISRFDASSFSNIRPAVQTFTQGEPECVPNVNWSEGNVSLIYKNPQQLTGNSSETVFQKLKKNFHLKYLKNKGHFKHSKESSYHTTGHENSESSCEAVSAACRRISGLQSFEYDHHLSGKSLRLAEEQNEWGQKNEKYDSHDSGIQMGNRGNLDSSESQDTDLQEDMDSPLMVRKRWIRDSNKFWQQDFINQTLTDRLKADFRWQSQIKTLRHGKGVRRTNSDVGDRKLFHSDFKNPDGSPLLASYSSTIRDENVWKTVWGLPSSGSAVVRNKFAGTKLRRSLSQPLGLNELPSFSRCSRRKCIALSEDEKNPRGRNPEDECLSDSESSVGSLQERKKSFHFASRGETAMLAEAVWDHVAIESCELPFKAGEVVEVLDTQNRDWWWGATARNKGYFPSAFVRLRVNQEDTVEDCLAAMAKGKYISNRLRRGTSVSLLSNDQVRSSVVRELLSTEKDFVKVLRDVKDGYVEQCKRRTDMFTSAQINTIFSNLEDLLVFQEKFLNDLEASMDKEFPYKSCIGNVFLNHAAGFRMYSEYCNSHPMAIATLQDLYQRDDYCKFFETCRLKQSLIAIPLDGYLLTPIQRICKYPLQLAELLKYTKPEHPDYQEVEQALKTMRGVATLINERKRKVESLEKLAAWQQRVEGWEGEDLIEMSSRLIHQGDVARITSGVWTSNITLFLFDHQIVYCKKDLLKRNVYIYKGRISLDSSIVVDVPDGKDQQLGVTVKYGLKICSSVKDKWLLFCCRNSEDKTKWLEALAEEKRLVTQDREVDVDLTATAKQLAKMAALTKEHPPCKPSGKNKFLFKHEEMPSRNCRPNASKTKSSRRVGTWFTLGGVIKNSKTNLRQRNSLHRVT